MLAPHYASWQQADHRRDKLDKPRSLNVGQLLTVWWACTELGTLASIEPWSMARIYIGAPRELSSSTQASLVSRPVLQTHIQYLSADVESKMASKVLFVSAILMGLITLSSCRSLGELSEQKTYSSTPSCIFSDLIPFVQHTFIWLAFFIVIDQDLQCYEM